MSHKTLGAQVPESGGSHVALIIGTYRFLHDLFSGKGGLA